MTKKTVNVTVTTKIVIEVEDGVEIAEVMQELDYNFTSGTDGAEIVNTEIAEFDITN